jgi:hypothetical protein
MALLPNSYLDAVLSIGTEEKDNFKTLATGFLAGFLTGEKNEQGNLYKVFLVTNRHVFEASKKVLLRFNLTSEGCKIYNLVLEDENGKKWLNHPNPKVDIAVVYVNFNQLIEDKIKCNFIDEESMAFSDTIQSIGISQGDSVFVLGFPMGISGKEKNYVIVRGGVISRFDPEIIKNDFQFLIDATVFPGNSGGPVIIRPELASLKGTKAVDKAYLIGVVRSYIPYTERAISEQTGETRIVFIENSGISGVVPMDFVKETVSPLMSKKETGDKNVGGSEQKDK